MKYTHDDSFVNLDDEFDESDKFEGPVENEEVVNGGISTPVKDTRKKVWRRTGNGQWQGERGLELRENEDFGGSGLYLLKRRSGKRLTGFEEADLIRAYRAGDKSAGDRLVESLLWLVRGIAGNQKERGKLKYNRAFYGPSFDDRVAAGIAGLVNAIEGYSFSRNTRLSTCARWWIMKSIGEECERWRYRGMGGQTRADRYLFSHSGAEAEEVLAHAHCSLESAQQAIDRLDFKEMPYNSTEGSNDDVGGQSICRRDSITGIEKKKSLVLADTYCPTKVHQQGHVVTDEDWEAIEAARSREWRGQDFYDQTVSNLREGWKGERHYGRHWRAHELNSLPEVQGYRVKYEAALKAVSRKLYTSDQAKAYRDAGAVLALRNLLPPARFLEHLTDQLDRDAARRLRQIGRNAYAHELVERDHQRIAARSEESQYLYPQCRSDKEKETKHENRIRGNAPISLRSSGINRPSNPSGRTTRFDFAQLHLQTSLSQRVEGAGIVV
jgi:hypothetical protein